MKRKVFSVNSELYKITGVEKVMMDIHHAIKKEYNAKIVGSLPYNKIHKDHGIEKDEYIKFWNPFIFYNSIVIVHERKLLILFWLLNHVFFQHIKILYIHHSLLYGAKRLTVMPKHIIAISDAGIDNLVNYFNVPREHITKIYNCVRDIEPPPHPYNNTKNVFVVLPARINSIKRQIEIVKNLKNRLSKQIRILFVGDGPLYNELFKLVKNDSQFECLGYRSDIYDILLQHDYMLLFSHHEGLPITLIEADMLGVPVICNDVGGNTEIVHDGENGFIVNDWDSLADCLNHLPEISAEKYTAMSKAGRAIYEKNFTFEIFKHNYLKLLSQL